MDQSSPYIITVVGPESSGKTTLASKLAGYFKAPLVPEYAREYLEGIGRPYDIDDLTQIAEAQLASQVRELSFVNQAKFHLRPNERAVKFSRSDIDLLGNFFNKSAISIEKESFGENPRPILVIDSGMLSLRMWSKLKYGIKIPAVEEALSQDVTSMYILCRPVYVWAADPLREAPLLLDRAWIYNHYLNEVMAIPSK